MNVPNEEIDSAGEYISLFPEVTHCYQRLPQPNFPYNLYSMLHCTNLRRCEELIEKIVKSIRVNDFKVLYSSKELKKTSMKYFVSG